MNKKRLYFVWLCSCITLLFGCSRKVTVQETEYSESASSAIAETQDNRLAEEKAIAEEQKVLNDLNYLPISPTDLKTMLLEKHIFLTDKSEESEGESYIHLFNEKNTMEIYLGNANDQNVCSISYTIQGSEPMQNKELKKEFLETMQTVLGGLQESYNEQVLIEAINNTKKDEVSPEMTYSDNLLMFFSQEENYLTFEIRAKSL